MKKNKYERLKLMAKKIFVVDDEKNIRDIVRSYLEKEGFNVSVFENGESALEEYLRSAPDMLVIDIMMPGMSGLELCNEIRKHANTPIIIVSARDEEIDRILGIEMGADDYMMKPFSPKELVARVKAVFRRLDGMGADKTDGNTIGCRDLVIYPAERRVAKVKDGKETDISFTAMEFDFLNFMISNKNRVFTRDQLLDDVWGFDYYGDSRTVDVHIKRLRDKLKGVSDEWELRTIWSVGYKFETHGKKQ